jgi:hypothetical protein
MPGPSITDPRGPLYKNDFGITILDPRLREEVLELPCERLAGIEGNWFGGRRPMSVAGPDA